jgi:hypothetical protein
VVGTLGCSDANHLPFRRRTGGTEVHAKYIERRIPAVSAPNRTVSSDAS